jgi:hypothetical protein
VQHHSRGTIVEIETLRFGLGPRSVILAINGGVAVILGENNLYRRLASRHRRFFMARQMKGFFAAS